MTSPPKIVLFAEGSLGQPTRRGDPFANLWQDLMVRELELLPIARVVPIDKRALVTMDPGFPPMSGASVGLDELILREIEGGGIDVAVVAWDLQPPWDPDAKTCRWDELCASHGEIDRRVIQPAVSAAKAVRPTPPVFRRIRGDFRTAKHEWAEYLLRELFGDDGCREQVVQAPICRRLTELIGE